MNKANRCPACHGVGTRVHRGQGRRHMRMSKCPQCHGRGFLREVPEKPVTRDVFGKELKQHEQNT